MHTLNAQQRAFLLACSHTIVAHLAPEELPLFDDLVEDYFEDPTPPKLSQEDIDDPLGAGFSEFLIATTTAACAMTHTALAYAQQVAPDQQDVPSPETVQAILNNQRQRDELWQKVYQTGRDFFIPVESAAQITDMVIALLAAPETQRRVINAWITDYPGELGLQLGQTYALNFNVAAQRVDALAMIDGIDALTAALPPGQEFVEMNVLIDAEDVSIESPNPQRLIVPRTGPSDSIMFIIRPQRRGPVTITAFFSIGNQIFQRMTINLEVGTAGRTDGQLKTTTSGIDLESGMRMQLHRQCLNLAIIKDITGYRILVQIATGFRPIFIKMTDKEVAKLVEDARRDFHNHILNKQFHGERIYQLESTTIPEEVHQEALHSLAQIGSRLYKKLFYDGRSEDVRAMGNLLRNKMRTDQFYISIIADEFVFPWAWLFIGETQGEIQPEDFWGFKHFIACVPEFSLSMARQFDHQITVDNYLHLGFVYSVNPAAKPERQKMIQRQRQVFQQLPIIMISDYVHRQELFTLLSTPDAAPHILYFYCHAVSHIEGDLSGALGSWFDLSDGEVTLNDLDRLPSVNLNQAPLVFLNSCGSARLQPYGSDGFVPYMIRRGARGVLGTEIDIPIYFSAEFGQELLRRLVSERATLGEIILALRREYCYERRNLLGLLYTLYSSNDIVIKRR